MGVVAGSHLIQKCSATKKPVCNLVEIGQVASEKKTLKDYIGFLHVYNTGAKADILPPPPPTHTRPGDNSLFT